MTENELQRLVAAAEKRILELEDELAQTNRGLVALTMELEQRVEQRTEALRLSQEDISRRNAILQGINRVLESTLRAGTEQELGEACLAIAEDLTGSKVSFIGEIGPDGLLHDLAISNPGWDLCKIYDVGGHRRAPGDFPIHGIYGRVLADGKSLIANQPSEHPDSIGLPAGHPPLTAFLGVPMQRDGKTIGMIAVGNREGGYGPEEQQALETLAPAIAAALARKRAEEALRQSESRFRTMANAMPQLAWTANPDGFTTWYNDKWYQYTGATPKDMEGWGWQSVHDPAVLPKVLERWKASIASGQPFEMVFPLRGSDGRFRPFLTLGQPLKDSRGRVVQWLGTNTDVDQLKRAEESLRRTAEELSRSNKELEQFAYIASHDLQEPLRMVTGFLNLLRERYLGKLDDKADQYIGFSVDGANRMSRLISDLLEYSRAGSRGLKAAPVNFADVLAQAQVNLRLVIQETGAVIRNDPLPTLTADAAQMTQLFQNLIGNAVKFRVDGKTPEILVGARPDEGGWVFHVKDNGIGINPQQAERIFLIFQRLHPPDKYAGSGIGLAICKKIVERHGGRIWVESQPGQGATFYFTLPG